MDLSTSVSTKSQRQVYLVFMVGIPGLGKTSLINKLKDSCKSSSRCGLEITRSDDVRSGVLAQEYASRGLDVTQLSEEDIYRIEVECGPKIKEELNKDICLKLEKLQDAPVDRKIFILDKNYCAKNLVQYIEEMASKILPECQVHKAVIVPQNFEAEEKNSIGPFDFDTIVIGLIRSLTRQNHITMNHGNLHTLLSYMSCLQSQYNDPIGEKFPKDQFPRIEVPFYMNHSVSNFKAAGHLMDQYERLRQVVTELASKKATIKDHVQFICSTINQLKQMNSFVDYDESTIQGLVNTILTS